MAYRAAVIGCGRMGATIDDERETKRWIWYPRSHGAWAVIQFAGGVSAHLVPAAGHFEQELFGDAGYVRARNNGRQVDYFRGPRNFLMPQPFPEPREVPYGWPILEAIIRELETGERAWGGVVTAVKGIAIATSIIHSHLAGGRSVPLAKEADESIYVPSH